MERQPAAGNGRDGGARGRRLPALPVAETGGGGEGGQGVGGSRRKEKRRRRRKRGKKKSRRSVDSLLLLHSNPRGWLSKKAAVLACVNSGSLV